MAQMNIIQAVNSAMHTMFERDETIVSFGEDAGYYGGVFRCTAGLQEKFGKHRSFDTPLAEGGIMGIAIGMGNHVAGLHARERSWGSVDRADDFDKFTFLGDLQANSPKLTPRLVTYRAVAQIV